MKKNFLLAYLTALIFILGTCSDPVFYTISQEVEPIPPLIDGSPTGFAVYNDALYAASGKTLFKYNTAKKETDEKLWESNEEAVPQPGGRIAQIASTSDYLYALCYEGTSSYMVLKRYTEDDGWIDIEESVVGRKIQYIYPAQDVLFVGIDISGTFSVYYVDDTAKTLIDMNCAEEITGAAFDGSNYYLCTKGYTEKEIKYGGIFWTDDFSGVTHITDSAGIEFTGMISIGNGILAAIARNGTLYTVSNDVCSVVKTVNTNEEEVDVSLGYMATGALAVWEDKDDSTHRLLLAGRQDKLTYSTDSGYTYGYMELELNSDGIKPGGKFVEPGINDITTLHNMDKNERFKSTIGKHPITSIIQTPRDIDDEMTLFASTQSAGVWSYRDHQENGNFHWNAEAEK